MIRFMTDAFSGLGQIEYPWIYGSFWLKAPLRFRQNLIRTFKFRRTAMSGITAGGILQVPVDNLLHFTDSNRPTSDCRVLNNNHSNGPVYALLPPPMVFARWL